ncbi:hypothetical protein sos41_11150 [Alphaproteobacteria bacterium SO-S41]|nr:hypothetical protein sos41_11150 [Alphaproteobacteria bacterium SO-S41]
MTEARLPPALLTPAITVLRAVHYGVLFFGLVGWLIPNQTVLVIYLAALIALVLQWRINADTCILDNIESWLRHGRFRAPETNPNEGAFLANFIHRVTGIRLTRAGADILIYSLMALFFVLGAAHLAWRAGAL